MQQKINDTKTVLQPLAVNQITLPNRIVFPAIQTNYANSDGSVSDKLINFYAQIAKGGCGLIFTGSASVSPDSVHSERTMQIHSDKFIPGLEKLFTKITQFGCVPGIQLMHAGRQALRSVTGHDLLAPSAIPCPVHSKLDPTYKVREMTLADIKRVQNNFVAAAVRAAHAGVKVIEIHAAHGYLLNEFLSPYTNHRSDQYGRSTLNRVRIITEILTEIRNKLQQKVAISVRISANEFIEGGLVPENFQDIIPCLENAGMDLLNVSVGTVETVNKVIPNSSLGETPFVDIATKIKNFTKVPVCTVGSIASLKTAAAIISAKKADLVAIGRSQVADPALVNKSLTDDVAKITKCLKCNKCLYWNTGDKDMHCFVNHSVSTK
ncbi:MAG: NADH:flavin oxidoreductase [Gammaproteobacteria bacterium]|nr:NADH:flavin oxidoreductase [Gammaproteobacteria bacterium]